MKSRDAVGHKIVRVEQERRRVCEQSNEEAWALVAIVLDNGSRIEVTARDTDTGHLVESHVYKEIT